MSWVSDMELVLEALRKGHTHQKRTLDSQGTDSYWVGESELVRGCLSASISIIIAQRLPHASALYAFLRGRIGKLVGIVCMVRERQEFCFVCGKQHCNGD